MLGRLASIRMLLSAAAPVLFALGTGYLGTQEVLALTLGLGIVAVLPLLWLRANLSTRTSEATQES